MSIKAPFTTENDIFARIAGVKDPVTFSDWKENLPKLQAVTIEDLKNALPEAQTGYINTIYHIHLQLMEYMQSVLDILGDDLEAYEHTLTDQHAALAFVSNLAKEDIPARLFEETEETQEEIENRIIDGREKEKPIGVRLLDAIEDTDYKTAANIFASLPFFSQLLIFSTYTNNTKNTQLIPQDNPFKKITVPLSPVVNSIFSNKPIELDTAVISKNAPTYAISADYETAQDAIRDKKTGKTVQFDEFERQMFDKLATLYEHPSFIWRGYRCTRFDDVYKLLIDDPEARLTAAREKEIERFIDKHARHRVSVDFGEIPGSKNKIKIDTNMLMVNVVTALDPHTEKPIKAICFVQEPLPLTLAKHMGRVSYTDDRHPMLMHVPRSAYALPPGINGTQRNISAVGYLARQITQKVYAKKTGKGYQAVIRLDPLFDAIGETVASRKTKVMDVIEAYMNRICKDTPEKPFPELKSWAWIDGKGNAIKQRAKAKKVYGIEIQL